jgi:putative ABC transport system permease protein
MIAASRPGDVKAESKRIFNRTFAVTAALNAFTLVVAGMRC